MNKFNDNSYYKNYISLYYFSIIKEKAESKKNRLTHTLKNLKQKVNFSRTIKSVIPENMIKESIPSEKPAVQTKNFFGKGKDYLELLRSYYQMKKRKIINKFNDKHLSFKYFTNNYMKLERAKLDIDASKKFWKRSVFNLNFAFFCLGSTYFVVQKLFLHRKFLLIRTTSAILLMGALTTMSNILIQGQINVYFKGKYKEVGKDLKSNNEEYNL